MYLKEKQEWCGSSNIATCIVIEIDGAIREDEEGLRKR